MGKGSLVDIDCTNYRLERRWRRIQPFALIYGNDPWHPVPGWLLSAQDNHTKEDRRFALKDIHEWRNLDPLTDYHKPLPTVTSPGHDAYLKNVGTRSDPCWVPCAKSDPGAVRFVPE